jgi:hypothetical protein
LAVAVATAPLFYREWKWGQMLSALPTQAPFLGYTGSILKYIDYNVLLFRYFSLAVAVATAPFFL